MTLYIKAALCYVLVLSFRRINIYKNCGCVKAAKLVQTGKSIWSGVFCIVNSFEFVSIFLHQYYESCFGGFMTPVKASGWNLAHQRNYSLIFFFSWQNFMLSVTVSDIGSASETRTCFLFMKEMVIAKGTKVNRLFLLHWWRALQSGSKRPERVP